MSLESSKRKRARHEAAPWIRLRLRKNDQKM
jgi:hypothetical protein